jgi:deoxyribose-phosphate aldolase
MDIEKLIAEITDEILDKVSSGGNFMTEKAGEMNIASYLDDTLLKADATPEQVIAICKEAKEYKTASVCVNSWYVPLVAKELAGSGVKTCCVIGFPLGACAASAKAAETAWAVQKGAEEVDMVVNIGAVKARDWQYVKQDIEEVVAAARGKALVKVIIETCLLTDEEKVKTCTVAKLAGADFVKTSTGFSTGGATVEDIRLMRQTVGPDMGVKASGGVRDYAAAKAMIDAGATRIGTSSAKGILAGAPGEK